MAPSRRALAAVSLFVWVLAAGSVASAQKPTAGRETSAASVASYDLSQTMPVERRYEDGDAADIAAVGNLPERIAALTAGAIQQAAQSCLDTENYVKVTLMPETK